MKKEFIICVIIICIIAIGNIFLQNYTKDSLNFISNNLFDIKDNIKDKEYSKMKIENINNECDKKFNVLTCFIKHEELQELEAQLVLIESEIESDNIDFLYKELDKTIYILQNIADEKTFKLNNIF